MNDKPVEPVDYAALNLAWGGLTLAVLAAARASGAQPPPGRELPLLGLASFTVAKALAKEKVGVWVREPLVEERDGDRRPKGTRLRYALGELVSCTRCLGTWSSLGVVGLRVLRPTEGRIVATVLASAAVNDWLQSGFSSLTAVTNICQREQEAPRTAPPLERLVEQARRRATGGGG